MVSRSVQSFIGSVGINTDLSYSGTVYTQTQNVLSALQYVDISTIRQTVPGPNDAYAAAANTLAQAGIKFDSVIPGDGEVNLTAALSNLDAFEKANPNSIAAIEGPNEVNAWPITYNGITNTYAAAVAVTQDLWNDVQADPLLKKVAVYAPTLSVDPTGEPQLGNLSSYVTYGNAHVYASGGNNVWSNDMPYWLPIQAEPTPGKPMVVTETGYSMISQGVNPDQLAAAKYTLNTLFDDALNGVAKTYIYQLVDEPATLGVPGSGLFNSDWTPKPAAIALHNLMSILQAEGPGAPSTTLNYSVSNLPSTAHTMQLGSATTSDIAIWNDVTVWDSNTNSDITAPTSLVTVNLGATYSSVQVYDPLSGKTPIKTYSNVSSVTLGLTDHPLILEVGSRASANDTLTLRVSEDAYEGNAKFTVKIDGVQIGGTLTASALHATGDSDVFTLTGNWGAGAHDVQLQFINDLYAGTPATDRNLYVNSVGYDGVTYSKTTAAMLGDGTHDFSVAGSTAAATAPADTLTLHLSEDAWNGNAQFQLTIDGKQISTPQDVVVLHSSGAWEDLTFAGNFGAGTHTVGVQFTNDAYGGSPTTDRNLYVNGVDCNGQHYGTGVTTLLSNGSATFAITTTH